MLFVGHTNSSYYFLRYTTPTTFAFSLYEKELCDDCEEERKVLPSLESFNKRMDLPKVHFIFFHYFFRAVIGENAWKLRMSGETERLGTIMAEAYANLQLNNNYFAWLYDYKMKHPHTTLKTEYDDMEERSTPASNDNEGGGTQTAAPQLFCGDLELVEVAVPTSATNADNDTAADEEDGEDADEEEEQARDDFELLLPSTNATTIETTTEMKAAREHDEKITKIIWERVKADKAGRGDGSTKALEYAKMCQALQKDKQASSRARTPDARRELAQGCRASKASLRRFTKGTRKSKKGCDEIKGWSVQGKLYMESMVKRIKRDVDNNDVRKKWEHMYKKICKVLATTENEGQGRGGDDDGDGFEMNEALMYVELIEV